MTDATIPGTIQDIVVAAVAIGVTFDTLTCSMIGGHLSCDEADALEALLRAVGCDREADTLNLAHGVTDDDEGDRHHDLYLAHREDIE